MRAVYRWVVCCALVLTAAEVQCAAELKVLATDPAPDALMARQQPFFVRFELTYPAPAIVTVGGLYKGMPVIDDGGAGAPAILPSGGGVGVVSFFYWGEKPTRIDEVRLKITDPAGGTNITEYAFPVTLTWLTDDPPPREPAPWVREWQQAQRAPDNKGTRNADAASNSIAPGAWLALGAGVMLLAIFVVWLRRRRRRAAANDDQARR